MKGRKLALLAVVFFLGHISAPPNYNFWNKVKEMANNPEIASLVFYGIAITLVLAAVVFVAKNIGEEG